MHPDPEDPVYVNLLSRAELEPQLLLRAVEFIDKVKHGAESVSNSSNTQSNPLHWAAWFDSRAPITRVGDEYSEAILGARQVANAYLVGSKMPRIPEEQFHSEKFSLETLLQDDVQGITVRVQWYVDEDAHSAGVEE